MTLCLERTNLRRSPTLVDQQTGQRCINVVELWEDFRAKHVVTADPILPRSDRPTYLLACIASRDHCVV